VFNGKRYMTRGIMLEVEFDLQMILWALIDSLKKNEEIETDYLQIFELEPLEEGKNGANIRVIHKQEREPYERMHKFRVANPVAGKIYCIDDGSHSTMLWSWEY